MRALVLLLALFLAGCTTTMTTSEGRITERLPGGVIRMSQSEFAALALLPTTYGTYSCRKPRGAGQINYCLRPRDLYATTLECRYERDGKWSLFGIFPFHEAYICRGVEYPMYDGRITHSYEWELSF